MKKNSTGTPKNKGGRPKKELSKEDMRQLGRCVMANLTWDQAAKVLNWSCTTLRDRPDTKQLYDKMRHEGVAEIATTLHEMASWRDVKTHTLTETRTGPDGSTTIKKEVIIDNGKPDITAAIFLLKTKGRWKTVHEDDKTDNTKQPKGLVVE